MTVRVGIIGCGSITKYRHAPEYHSNKNCEIVAFSDLNLERARELAYPYIEEEAVTERFLVDAQHIAIATVNRVNALVSWNFKHIVNLKRVRLYNSVNLRYGYYLLEIRSPVEVLDEEERI